MRNTEIMLLSIWLVLVVCAVTLTQILDELEGCKIVYLSRESSGDAAAVAAANLPNPGGDR